MSTGMDRRGFVGRSASIVGAASLAGLVGLDGELGAQTAQDGCGKPRRSVYEGRIIAKAWRDPAYRSALLSNPKAVLERELRTRLPTALKVQVVEERKGLIYMVLPMNPNAYSEKRMDDPELTLLAGGIRFDTPCDSIASLMPAWFYELQFYPRSRSA